MFEMMSRSRARFSKIEKLETLLSEYFDRATAHPSEQPVDTVAMKREINLLKDRLSALRLLQSEDRLASATMTTVLSIVGSFIGTALALAFKWTV